MEMNGRYEHIEDVLTHLHEGFWCGWLDSSNKVYENLVIYDAEGQDGYGCDKPTEKELTDALAKQQSDFDAQEYARNRALSYPSTGDQLDMIYKDMKNSTTTHADAVEVVKTKYPKE